MCFVALLLKMIVTKAMGNYLKFLLRGRFGFQTYLFVRYISDQWSKGAVRPEIPGSVLAIRVSSWRSSPIDAEKSAELEMKCSDVRYEALGEPFSPFFLCCSSHSHIG